MLYHTPTKFPLEGIETWQLIVARGSQSCLYPTTCGVDMNSRRQSAYIATALMMTTGLLSGTLTFFLEHENFYP